MSYLAENNESIRRLFPALSRHVAGKPAVYFDGPAGTQVPQTVIDAIVAYLSNCNANHEGLFATSRESDGILDETHSAVADLIGADDRDEVFFGPNMTTLTFALSRSLATRWRAGDEIIVTRLDHDANVSPWVLAARDAGATVKFVPINESDCTLNLEVFQEHISQRTRLVAVGCASNATGTINPVRQIASWAHAVGALVFLDAVHYAPHAAIDVSEWDCDFLACSAYKFFGPHVGIMWGRRNLLEELPAFKVRPASNELPGKWMTGTQNHECLAGTLAAVNYLAELGRASGGPQDRRGALLAAYHEIQRYERMLIAKLIAGIAELPEIHLWGIADPARIEHRLPTISITHQRLTAKQLASRLGEQGIFVWHGNYYALQLTESLGLEPEGMVRIGLVHYNSEKEVQRLLSALADVA